jgi:hypothetical protein
VFVAVDVVMTLMDGEVVQGDEGEAGGGEANDRQQGVRPTPSDSSQKQKSSTSSKYQLRNTRFPTR